MGLIGSGRDAFNLSFPPIFHSPNFEGETGVEPAKIDEVTMSLRACSLDPC